MYSNITTPILHHHCTITAPSLHFQKQAADDRNVRLHQDPCRIVSGGGLSPNHGGAGMVEGWARGWCSDHDGAVMVQ